MRVKFLPKLMQASLICCLALIFTGCEEFLNSLDNPVSSELKMDNSPVTLKVGESRTRTAKARTGAIVTYSSSNEAVATVDQNGTVTAVAEGTATITASVTGGTVQGTNIPFIQESVSYEVTVESAIDPLLATPLTLEVTSAGTIVVNSPKDGMQYSLNGGAKTAVPNGTAIGGGNLSVGDKVAFYGNGTTITNYNGTIIKNGTAHVKVYGNIMSLLSETNFATATTLTAEKTFREFFRNYSNLIDASGLLLPAETLASSCYYEMFYSCSGMTAAPAELPAEALASSCYYEMFSSCSKLTAAPVLPAKTLVSNCYKSMFSYCSKLSSVTCLATSDINSNNSTNGWLTSAGWQAAGVKTFTAASGAEWPEGNNGIPTGWTRVNQ